MQSGQVKTRSPVSGRVAFDNSRVNSITNQHQRKLPTGTSELHYMMGAASTNSSLLGMGPLYTATSDTIFKQKSKPGSNSGSKSGNASKTDRTQSRQYPNLDSSSSIMSASQANRSKSSIRSKSRHKKATRMDKMDLLNDTGFAMGL